MSPKVMLDCHRAYSTPLEPYITLYSPTLNPYITLEFLYISFIVLF